MEPENFYFPVRHCLGAALLKQADDLIKATSQATSAVVRRAVEGTTTAIAATTTATATATATTTATTTTTREMIENTSAASAATTSTTAAIHDATARATTTTTTTTSAIATTQTSATTTTPRLRELYTQAITIYESDLRHHPATGWSLKGLALALQGLGALGETHVGQGLGQVAGLSPTTTATATATTASAAAARATTARAAASSGGAASKGEEEKELSGANTDTAGLVRISDYLPLVQTAFEQAPPPPPPPRSPLSTPLILSAHKYE